MEIKIIKGDIIKIKVDAIVNAAAPDLLGGGGVDGAIHRAAGSKLLEACKKLGGCKTGEAKITKGYKLPSKYVIHTVGPIYGRENGKEADLLASCYENCLTLAKERHLRTIAFPAISTGTYGYPKKEAAPTALRTIKEFCANNPNCFDEISFILYDEENYRLYKSFLK